MSGEMYRTLKDLSDCHKPPGLPWTQDGTRVGDLAKRLEDRGFVDRIGESPTGTYWAVTAEGHQVLTARKAGQP